MLVGVVSDTHNNLKNIEQIISLFNNEEITLVIHTGDITNSKSLEKFSNEKLIKVDFSILKRYTDEFQDHLEVYFIRADYLDNYIHYKKDFKTPTLEPYDYFKVSTTKLIDYKLIVGGNKSDEKPLLFLAWNLFLQINSGLTLLKPRIFNPANKLNNGIKKAATPNHSLINRLAI